MASYRTPLKDNPLNNRNATLRTHRPKPRLCLRHQQTSAKGESGEWEAQGPGRIPWKEELTLYLLTTASKLPGLFCENGSGPFACGPMFSFASRGRWRKIAGSKAFAPWFWCVCHAFEESGSCRRSGVSSSYTTRGFSSAQLCLLASSTQQLAASLAPPSGDLVAGCLH